MVAVMIGIDPRKAWHTAVAIDPAEVPLGQLQVRACAAQAERLPAAPGAVRTDPRRRQQGDHRRPGRAHPGVIHPGRRGRGGPLRARRRAGRGSARHRRPAPRHQEEAGHSGPGGTSLTGLSGIGPVSATAIIGDVRHVSRFPGRDHFASCNGTAPIEVSSGGRKVRRLSRRGNRRHGHAIHMAAVTQIRHRHSPGRAC
jgi:transposase